MEHNPLIPEKLELNWLYLDLNSYFATIEQQLDKAIRNRPVIIVAVLSDYTCAIAASIEAKKYGIKTGTNVKEAKKLCPDLICIVGRHDIYVEYHHRILAEVDKYLHVDHVLSIDECACRLTGTQKAEEEAVKLARSIKAAIRKNVGDYISCSIGIAPNRFLAKVATDMQKPDGLVIIRPEDIPQKLYRLKLRDLAGIGSKTERKLQDCGIHSVEDLYRRDARALRNAWGSIVGERFWYALRGVELEEVETKKSSVGRSRVLPPELREINAVKEVFIELVLKAASRLRIENLYTCKINLSLLTEKKMYHNYYTKSLKSNDSKYLLQEAIKLWETVVDNKIREKVRIKKIGISFTVLSPKESSQLSFFDQQIDQIAGNNKLSTAIDKINEKYGRNVISIGIKPNRKSDNARIAFNRIPDKKEFF